MKRNLSLLAVALLAISCVAPRVEILSPGPGLAVFAPIDVEVRWVGWADPASPQVLLNGVDITSLLELSLTPEGGTLGVARDVWGAGLVLPGANVVEASITVGGSLRRHVVQFETQGDPYADAVLSFTPGPGAGFGQTSMPGIVLGEPFGEGPQLGSLDVVTLGQGGVIELEFVDNAVVDGPGADFTVFENAFFTTAFGFVDATFAEPGRVSVSQDGVVWFPFPCAATSPPLYAGCAGVRPTLSTPLDPTTAHATVPSEASLDEIIGQPEEVLGDLEGSGGDTFDLADVGLPWIAFVRIEDVGPALGQAGTIGMEIDAVAGIHTIPFVDANVNGVPDAFDP